MGTSRTPAQLVAKINHLATVTQQTRKIAVAEGALATKQIMLATAAAKGVTPGGKIAGRKWNVSYDVKGTNNPTALVRFTGPFHLVENATKPHYIAAKGLGGSRASRGERAFQASASRFLSGSSRASGAFGGARRSKGAKALHIGSSLFRAYVFHPGTSGKGVMPIARTVAARRVPHVMASSMRGSWRRVIS